METITRPAGIATVREEIAAACRDAGRDPATVTLVAVSKTFGAEAIVPVIDRGPAHFRRESGAGSQGQMAAADRPKSRPRTAPDRTVAIQQSARGGGTVRRDPFARPGEPRRGAEPRKSASRGDVLRCLSRSIPAPSRKRPACCRRTPMRFVAACRDTYGLEISGLMCIPPHDEAPAPHFALTAKIAQPQRPETAVDGHECRFQDRDRLRRHSCPGRQRDFRGAADAESLSMNPDSCLWTDSRQHLQQLVPA